MLIDRVEVTVSAGKGGNGVVSWRREKYVPNGGPDGGDGGRGGSVYFRSSNNLDTLSAFRYRKVFQAENGVNGAGKKKTGRSGKDLELLVPVGTIIFNLTTNQVVADLKDDNVRILIAKGGKGGLGNVHFATSTHQEPQESTDGLPGESKSLRLELRLIADVALIGQPNAGKSSLITAITGVESRIGAYPFSTTEPILGVMRVGDRNITIVDLPGLLEGAHKGKGLGDQFLKHLMRVKYLLHVVDATDPNLKTAESIISNELKQFDPRLAELPRQVVLNKIDLLTKAELTKLKKTFPEAILVSAVVGTGLKDLTRTIEERILTIVS